MSDYRTKCAVIGCTSGAYLGGSCEKHQPTPDIGHELTKKQVALKYDEGKPDFTYLSLELLVGLGKVREFGALKKKPKPYGRDNWKSGFKITRSLAAALRHTEQFLHGEDYDEESGLLHLYHAVACLEHAIYDYIHHSDKNDDRNIDTKNISIEQILSRITRK